MEEKKQDKINIKNLNRCIREYRKLGHLLNIISFILMAVLIIYIINKLKIIPIVLGVLKLLTPLFIGIIFAWLLSPFVDKLNKKLPKVLSCIIVYLIFIGIIVLIFALVIPNFITQIKDLITAFPDIIKDIQNVIYKYVGYDNNIDKTIMKMVNDIGSNMTSTLPDRLIVGTKSFISVVVDLGLGLMISFYLSYDYHKMTRGFYKLVPDKYRTDARDLISRINHSLRKYIQGVSIVMLFVFLSQAVGLTLAGLRAPLIFALFCALTDIIPYFGPWIGAIPAIIVALTMSPLTAIFTIISIVVVQALENNFYQPLIMGHTMKLHPVTIMLGLIFFGHYFGVIGMIIATPVVATLKIILVFVDEKLKLMDKINTLIANND